MPTPKDGEKETDFMERCVPMMQDEGMPNKQAVATCMNMFREKKGFFALKAMSLDQKRDKITRAFLDMFFPSVPNGMMSPHAWIADIYDIDGYLIVQEGEKYSKVTFTEDGDGYKFADRSEWMGVEQRKEWVEKNKALRRNIFKTTAVIIKSINADKAIVAGWGVIFDGKDLEGETFTSDTDFMLDLVKEKATLYDHGANQGVKASIIGRANVEPDEFGLWVEAELDLHQKYVDQVLKLVEKSALGWSSGALGHLVQKDGHKIKRWPIVEFSLTTTPAEPRTLGVERLKSLAENYPDLNALIPEAAASGDEGARNRLKLQALAYTQYGE